MLDGDFLNSALLLNYTGGGGGGGGGRGHSTKEMTVCAAQN